MKTLKKQLVFKTDSVIELNNDEINEVTGGSMSVLAVAAVVVMVLGPAAAIMSLGNGESTEE